MSRAPTTILVLCTGNSARSQIAAAYLRELLGDRFEILSAGTEPAAEIHPLAIEVMGEVGIEVSGEPRDYRDYLETLAPEHVIIVCDGAATACPVWPGAGELLYWPFEDPAAAEGSTEERRAKFREVRNQIRDKIHHWVAGDR